MSLRRSALAGAVFLAAAGCGKAPPPERDGGPGAAGGPPAAPPDQEPPVAVNPDSPIQYPPKLFDQKVEGDVVLRLYVDSLGRLVPESSVVAEPSGYAALDSAALAGAKRLRFAPARRRGLPVATAFLQPIEFRHPAASGAVIKGGPDSSTPRRETPRAPRDTGRPRPDTTTPRADTTRPRPDTSGVRRDTSGARRDTTTSRADTSGAPR